ncbi:MAG: S41 family peptidase [Candidatus Magasanikbacteria bacterium CG_4_9_14_3_um_filter_32_9]|uniref:S41 family peptidase n=1 Tax=Candidatus Magasanikbacteria bacterium CG_4_9_14_3_um_filter_32_9 TaxID=1974644 RepID=A0A2M7Z7T8_9BACT|nr:MAG: S41 family peptidase [Candidatus Magasanikbacteria bacterium CG_4_9_14_3_um_filter_32_9]
MIEKLKTNGKFNKFFYVLITGLFVVIFVLGFFSGKLFTLKTVLSSESGNIEIEKVLNLYSKTRSPNVDFNQFWKIWNTIKEDHVNAEISDVDLFYGSLEGLVASLKDPYSIYFPPKEATEFAKDLAGEFEGIGAEIGIKEDRLIVVAPLAGSPAEKAGLKAQDKVLAIDGEDSTGLNLQEAVMKIRGEKGTPVVLTISRNGYGSLQEVEIIRGVITVPTVIWEMKDDGIAYVRISYFSESTYEEFNKVIQEIMVKLPKGLVLDLRSNPGGYLKTSVEVASEWIEKGPIVLEKFRDGTTDVYDTTGRHRLGELKTVVLVDGGTASGSEIVAGALQDYEKATIIGQQTFGKGSVQDFQALTDGSALKITIAKWFTPLDRGIDGEGIVPDVVLEKMFTETDEENEYKDLGLEKAIEILLAK